MSLDRDMSIIAQNAGTAAGNIYAALVKNRGDGAFNPEEYEAIRLHVFQGTLELAGAETVVEVFEGDASEKAQPQRPVYGTRSNNDNGGGGSGSGSGNIEVKFGKHRGKTISEIYDEDEGWLRWAADNANNDFVRKHAQKFLAAAS